ncbi:DUF2397 family protein [Bacillus sp. N9]
MVYGTGRIEEAHQLSAIVFGSMTVQHLRLEEGTTENLHADTWEERADLLTIKPRTNRYREKTKPGSFRSNEKRKLEQRKLYLQERKQEKELIEQYMDQGTIRLSSLETVEPFIRKVLLGWIGKAMANENRMVTTDYGLEVKVTLHKERKITLRADDGNLVMPDATFEFND